MRKGHCGQRLILFASKIHSSLIMQNCPICSRLHSSLDMLPLEMAYQPRQQQFRIAVLIVEVALGVVVEEEYLFDSFPF